MGRRVASLTLACSGFLGTTLLLLSGVIPRCFTSDPAVLKRLGKLLPLLAVQQPLIAMTLVTEGLLVGAGQVRTTRSLFARVLYLCKGQQYCYIKLNNDGRRRK